MTDPEDVAGRILSELQERYQDVHIRSEEELERVVRGELRRIAAGFVSVGVWEAEEAEAQLDRIVVMVTTNERGNYELDLLWQPVEEEQ